MECYKGEVSINCNSLSSPPTTIFTKGIVLIISNLHKVITTMKKILIEDFLHRNTCYPWLSLLDYNYSSTERIKCNFKAPLIAETTLKVLKLIWNHEAQLRVKLLVSNTEKNKKRLRTIFLSNDTKVWSKFSLHFLDEYWKVCFSYIICLCLNFLWSSFCKTSMQNIIADRELLDRLPTMKNV